MSPTPNFWPFPSCLSPNFLSQTSGVWALSPWNQWLAWQAGSLLNLDLHCECRNRLNRLCCECVEISLFGMSYVERTFFLQSGLKGSLLWDYLPICWCPTTFRPNIRHTDTTNMPHSMVLVERLCECFLLSDVYWPCSVNSPTLSWSAKYVPDG